MKTILAYTLVVIGIPNFLGLVIGGLLFFPVGYLLQEHTRTSIISIDRCLEFFEGLGVCRRRNRNISITWPDPDSRRRCDFRHLVNLILSQSPLWAVSRQDGLLHTRLCHWLGRVL
jgi:hypothetical protein